VGLTSQPENGNPPQLLFVVPWRNRSIIGTYHIRWRAAAHTFKPNEAMVQGFLGKINRAHPPLKLLSKDVRQVTWGFLPVHREDANEGPIKLARDGVVIDHQKKDGKSGLISILGVNYTTARAVAEQAVDLAVSKLGARTQKCQTHTTPVKGGKIEDFRALLRQARKERTGDLNERFTDHLVYTYGSEYRNLMQSIAQQPDLARRIAPPLAVTVAEVDYAVRHEMALTLADVIKRRTELGATGPPSLATLQQCADLIGREFQWSLERQQQEIEGVLEDYRFKQIESITA
jgi:glycerol-3-phosphate dehydrogenase